MSELFITVTFPGMRETTYTFDTFPVRIGRGEANHLTIRHRAVARELCVAWIEPDGRTVRVEERPLLTNPLLMGKTRVEGGVSREAMTLSAGPCSIGFYTRKKASPSDRRKRGFSIGVTLVFIVLITMLFQKKKQNSLDITATLPKTPLCEFEPTRCDDRVGCREQARIVLTRAREMLSRPSLDPGSRARAVGLMRSAADLYAGISEELAAPVYREADERERQLNHRYQGEVVRLKQAIAAGDPLRIRTAARRVLDHLTGCDIETEALRRLAQHEMRGAVK